MDDHFLGTNGGLTTLDLEVNFFLFFEILLTVRILVFQGA